MHVSACRAVLDLSSSIHPSTDKLPITDRLLMYLGMYDAGKRRENGQEIDILTTQVTVW
jgi:hypothetical protein